LLLTSGFRLASTSGSSSQNAEVLCGSGRGCNSWSLFSGLSLEARLLGVVNVRGRRAPTDRSSSRRDQLVRLAALGWAIRKGCEGRGRWTRRGRGRALCRGDPRRGGRAATCAWGAAAWRVLRTEEGMRLVLADGVSNS
jgi:hypothetical protein